MHVSFWFMCFKDQIYKNSKFRFVVSIKMSKEHWSIPKTQSSFHISCSDQANPNQVSHIEFNESCRSNRIENKLGLGCAKLTTA